MRRLFVLTLLLVLLPGFALAADFEQIAVELPDTVAGALAVAMALIFFDAFLGAVVAIREQRFEIEQLPRFLVNNVWPWTAVLILLAGLAYFVGEWFYAFYFMAVAAVVADYVIEVNWKFQALRDSMKKEPNEGSIE